MRSRMVRRSNGSSLRDQVARRLVQHPVDRFPPAADGPAIDRNPVLDLVDFGPKILDNRAVDADPAFGDQAVGLASRGHPAPGQKFIEAYQMN